MLESWNLYELQHLNILVPSRHRKKTKDRNSSLLPNAVTNWVRDGEIYWTRPLDPNSMPNISCLLCNLQYGRHVWHIPLHMTRGSVGPRLARDFSDSLAAHILASSFLLPGILQRTRLVPWNLAYQPYFQHPTACNLWKQNSSRRKFWVYLSLAVRSTFCFHWVRGCMGKVEFNEEKSNNMTSLTQLFDEVCWIFVIQTDIQYR